MKISEKLIELRIATRRACSCENSSGAKKNTLSLKTKILFLIKDKPLPPNEIMSALFIVKSNLAAITKQLENEGLIEKLSCTNDKREKILKITESGLNYLQVRLDCIEVLFKNILTSNTETDEAIAKLDGALDLLSFLER